MRRHLISNDKGHKSKLRNEMMDCFWKGLIARRVNGQWRSRHMRKHTALFVKAYFCVHI